MYSTRVWAISSFHLVFTRSHLHSMKAAQTVAKRIMLSSPQHTLCWGKSIPMVLYFSSDISRHLLTYKEPLLQYWQVGFPEGPSMFVLFYVRSELVAVVYRRALWSWVSFYQQDTPAVKCLSSANCQSKISIKIKKTLHPVHCLHSKIVELDCLVMPFPELECSHLHDKLISLSTIQFPWSIWLETPVCSWKSSSGTLAFSLVVSEKTVDVVEGWVSLLLF